MILIGVPGSTGAVVAGAVVAGSVALGAVVATAVVAAGCVAAGAVVAAVPVSSSPHAAATNASAATTPSSRVERDLIVICCFPLVVCWVRCVGWSANFVDVKPLGHGPAGVGEGLCDR